MSCELRVKENNDIETAKSESPGVIARAKA
jgi:hypothetical protein